MPRIKRAKKRLEDRIAQAYLLLGDYGVTLEALYTLVESSLYGDLKNSEEDENE